VARTGYSMLSLHWGIETGVGEGNVHMMGDGRAYRDVLSTRGMERRKSRVTFASVVGSGNWGASLFEKSAV
jgi:hypothetical protein